MRILADLHISPVTVADLRALGHDVVRVHEVTKPNASDLSITELADHSKRVVLTQDLDFSDLVALGNRTAPSLITLRLASSRVEHVNSMSERVLPLLEEEVLTGVAITVTEHQVRKRTLPIR